MTLTNQKLVIIGGSSGIGLATAIQAASLGAHIVIASRSAERLRDAKKQISGEVESFCLDVSDEEQVKEFFPKIGPFDHLITSGSFSAPGTFPDTESARKSFDSKFWGQYYAAKHGVPHMRTGGSIVLFSGVLSHRPVAGTAIMTSINSAVEGLGRALAVDLAPLRVNVLSAGYIDTPRFAKLTESEKQTVLSGLTKQLPLQRMGTAKEAAQAVLYLVTNTYVTGTALYVDGGYALR